MKRAVSRASKLSADAQDSLEIFFPGIPEAKWHELVEREETDLFLLGLREEIVEKSLSICYETYLDRQAVAFTVHCAFLAWCKVLNIYEMFRDPGDADDTKGKESWEPDLEPEPSIIDSWGSESIAGDMPPPVVKGDKESEKDSTVPVVSYTTVELGQEESMSIPSRIFYLGEGEYSFSLDSFSTTNLVSEETRSRSIFTRTLSMSRESLPLVKPSALPPGECKGDRISDRKLYN